jgi:GNAT superfamily N-acetyltransferase
LTGRDDGTVNDPSIRDLLPDDLEEFRRMVCATIDQSYAGVYSSGAIRFFKEYHSLENIRSDAAHGQTIVALDKGEIIGTGTLLGSNIRRVFVVPSLQGRGLGGMIMAELERRAAEAMADIVDLDSSMVSVDFYRRRGYQEGERSSIGLEGGETLEYVPMRKSIIRNAHFSR